MHEREHDEDCSACELPPARRTFLKELSLAAVGALVMAGMPGDLAAMVTPTAIKSRNGRSAEPSYPVPAEDGVQIDKDNEVILVRWQGTVVAFNLSCPHQNTALKWRDKKHEFECPKHHSRYQPTGAFIAGRATRHMDRFAINRDEHGEVVVHVGHMIKSDADPDAWAKASLRVA